MMMFPAAVAAAATPYSIFLFLLLPTSMANAHNSSFASLAALVRCFRLPAQFDDFCRLPSSSSAVFASPGRWYNK